MTPELEALPPKRRAFVLALVGEANGNYSEAARRAGYKKPEMEGSRLMKFDAVRAAVDSLASPKDRASIATVNELREMWTKIARGEMEAPMKERLKATELLGKSQGAFIERHEVHNTGTPQVGIVIVDNNSPAAAEFLRGVERKEG